MGNHSAAQYELLDSGLPFLIERNTGILTTIAVFHDKVGDMYNARILVRDNYGIAPSLTTICDLRVRDWLLCLLNAYWFVFQVYVVSDEYRIIVTISLSIDFVRSNIVTITKYETSCFVYIAMWTFFKIQYIPAGHRMFDRRWYYQTKNQRWWWTNRYLTVCPIYVMSISPNFIILTQDWSHHTWHWSHNFWNQT